MAGAVLRMPLAKASPAPVYRRGAGYRFDRTATSPAWATTTCPSRFRAVPRFFRHATARGAAQLHQLPTRSSTQPPRRPGHAPARRYLAGLSTQLEKAGHPSDVAQFLMRCLFTISRGRELIPTDPF
jgi:hypothetical protein